MIDELFSTHFLYNGLIEIAIKISTTTNDDYNDLKKGNSVMGICLGLETPTSFRKTPSFPYNICTLASLQHKQCKYGLTFTFETRRSGMDR
jgi:hypothetical protein